MHCRYGYASDEFEPLYLIQDGGAAAILDIVKPVISPALPDQFLPNLAVPCIVAIDKFRMSFNL